MARTLPPLTYGAITLYGGPFQATSARGESCAALEAQPPTIHATSPARHRAGFGLGSSPFPRRYSGNLDLISSPPPTWMFPFGGFALPGLRPGSGRTLIGSCQEVPFGDPRIYGRMRLPGAYRSLPRPSSPPEPSHPPGGVFAPSRMQHGSGLHAYARCPSRDGERPPHPIPLHPSSASFLADCICSAVRAARDPISGGSQALVGGDPAAPSGTATLLRLLPPRPPPVRWRQRDATSLETDSGGATGGVCKRQGRIHRAMVTRGY